jgi:hypothetical protein
MQYPFCAIKTVSVKSKMHSLYLTDIFQLHFIYMDNEHEAKILIQEDQVLW